jgi:hypothetical protein
MGNYKIENSKFTFDVDELFSDYSSIKKFPMRPSKIEGLEEILFQITEMRDDLPELAALVIYETPSYQYIVENRKGDYSNDVYLKIYKIHRNDLREVISNSVVNVSYLEEFIIQHISSNLEWNYLPRTKI